MDNITHELDNQNQKITNGLDTLPKVTLRMTLESKTWFQKLDADSKTLIKGNIALSALITTLLPQEKPSICLGQVQIILKQDEVMTSMDKMNAVLKNLRNEVKISQISARDRGHIQDIDEISKKFERILRGKFGTFLPSHQ
jgi:hypothetical protein